MTLPTRVPVARLVALLPCSICGLPGPHSFRLEAAHGIVAVCGECQPSENAGKDVRDRNESVHPATSAARNLP
ncbi:MAG TPA: hypothetical protein VFI96_04285 [Longimicrobiaceae bacterium]|nr:hypothetical protein [Longimicrobiaceae bacterium]